MDGHRPHQRRVAPRRARKEIRGGLLLLSLATGHPALGRVVRLVLTNCESYDKFPPDGLKKATALCRTLPRLARALLRLQLRSSIARRRAVSTVAASGLDPERDESFYGPARRDPSVVDDLVVAMAGFRPQLLIDSAQGIPRFDSPVLLIWGDSCTFFPITDAQRLASELPAQPCCVERCPGFYEVTAASVDDSGRQILERAPIGQPVGESSRRRPHPPGGLGRHARQPRRYALRAPLHGRRLTRPKPSPTRNFKLHSRSKTRHPRRSKTRPLAGWD
jgi:hypothetical protein